jgi:hypothetical protein
VLLLPLCQIHSVASPLYGKFTINGILGEQPDKHDQSDLEVDIVFQSRDRRIAPATPTGNERRIDSGTK